MSCSAAGRRLLKATARRSLPGLALTLFLFAFHTSAAFCQQENESRVPERETQSQKAAGKAAAKSEQLIPGGEITYGQVLADPDNVQLNFQYAKRQISRGDLKGVAATLERILLIQPDLAQVRLLYGIVLFRLDNLEESERSLKAVQGMQISPSLREEVAGYLRQIKLRRKRTRFTATLSAGMQYDTNRNAAPDKERRYFANAIVHLTGDSLARRDSSVIGITSLEVVHDLGMQGGHELFASFDHYIAEQTDVDQLDLQSFSAEGGGVIKTPWVDFTPSLFASHILLSRETFLRTQGTGFRFDRPLTPRLHLFQNTRWAREEYSGISENPVAHERTGDSLEISLGSEYLLNPTMRLDLIGTWAEKNTKAPYFDYTEYGAQVRHTWLLGKGQFLQSAFSYDKDTYEDPDHALSGRTRVDSLYRTRLTYGLPVGIVPLLNLLPKSVLNNLGFTLTAEYFKSQSKLLNYKYGNMKVQGLFTKKFEF